MTEDVMKRKQNNKSKVKEQGMTCGSVSLDNVREPLIATGSPAVFMNFDKPLDLSLPVLQDSINISSQKLGISFAPTLNSFESAVTAITEPLRIATNGISFLSNQYQQSAVFLSDIVFNATKATREFSSIVVDFPVQNALISIDPSTTFELGIQSASALDTTLSGISFASVAHQRTSIGILDFETEQTLMLKVDRLETKVDDIQTLLADVIYPFLVEDSARKDNILDELLAFYKGKPQTFAKVREVQFSDRTCKLHIDKTAIPLQQGKNEETLCRVIFRNKSSIDRLWNIDEIVEKMGESLEQTRFWKRRLYQTARQLNHKIALETGYKDFLIYTMSTICVNPTYLISKK